VRINLLWYTMQSGQTRVMRRGFWDGRGTGQWSHLSHLSSCLTVFVLQTPQAAVREVAHGAFSVISWPQPYLCTTLVHMLVRVVEWGRRGRTAGSAFCNGVGCARGGRRGGAWTR
jgi:hypothetical protein